MSRLDSASIMQENPECSMQPESHAHESTHVVMARRAIEDISEQLAQSPHNPGYLTSPVYTIPREWLEQHADAIEDSLTLGLEALSPSHRDTDLWHVGLIRSGNILHRHQRTGEVKRLHPMFAINDFLNAGIEDILTEARSIDTDTPPHEINQRTVDAIGAMLLRGIYFQQLSEVHPESFTPHERDVLLGIFQQNIITAIRRATRLTTRREPTINEPLPAAQATGNH